MTLQKEKLLKKDKENSQIKERARFSREEEDEKNYSLQ